MNNDTKNLLNEANALREEEKYGESAKKYMDGLLRSVSEKDFVSMVHALGGMSLVYKHQVPKTDLNVYKALVLVFGEQAYKAAEMGKVDPYTASIAYRVYGDALLTNGRAEEALSYFEKSFNVSTADRCEKGNLKAHIGGIKYKLGRKEEGLAEVKEALEDIRSGDESYTKRVWETGCLNKLAIAEILAGNKEGALAYINESIGIATEHNLTIRLREAKEILEKIEQGKTDFGV